MGERDELDEFIDEQGPDFARAVESAVRAQAAEVEVVRLRQALTAIRDEHVPISHDPGFCAGCTFSWPCITRRTADAVLGGSSDEHDPEPRPSDGPEYHADHAAWRERQRGFFR